jgi:hypothetical protein
MSPGRRRLIAWSGASRAASIETTLASAWTPASVRPATVSAGGSTASAAARSPAMVRSPGCAAHPWKSVPS